MIVRMDLPEKDGSEFQSQLYLTYLIVGSRFSMRILRDYIETFILSGSEFFGCVRIRLRVVCV